MRRARLLGGHYDGCVATIDRDALTRGLRLAIPPTIEDFAVALPGLSPTEQALMPNVAAREELYRFDGSVNEHGEYRFRWLDEPDHRN